jgi:hypothetical protein
MKSHPSESRWWLAAFALPLAAVAIGAIWTGVRFGDPVHEALSSAEDPLRWGIVAGAVLACISAVISTLKKEPLRGFTLITSIPAAIILGDLAVQLLS